MSILFLADIRVAVFSTNEFSKPVDQKLLPLETLVTNLMDLMAEDMFSG